MSDLDEVRRAARLHVGLGLIDLDPNPPHEVRAEQFRLRVAALRNAFGALGVVIRESAAAMQKFADEFAAVQRRASAGETEG